MALRSLLTKCPALGLRSPAGPLMGSVHALSPAAAYRPMSSHARKRYVDPDPRFNKLMETLDKKLAESNKAHRDMMAVRQKILDKLNKWDKLSKAVCYPLNACSAFVLLVVFPVYRL
nr:uncharacterized protein LOC127336627 [Lolium perenne]